MDSIGLYNGWSGVRSYEQGIESVSDNLANTQTVGFKSTRANFGDMLSQQVSTAAGVGAQAGQNQVGKGSYVTYQNIMSQGSLTASESNMDLAIKGEGFFVVSPKQAPDQYFTRAGRTLLDKNGFLVNQQGLRIQGYPLDADGNPNLNAIGDLQFDGAGKVANATTRVNIAVALNAEEEDHLNTQAIDPSDTNTYDFTAAYKIYNAAGDSKDMINYYQKLDSFPGTAPAGTTRTWRTASYEYANGAAKANPASPDNIMYLHFDSKGHLLGTTSGNIATGDGFTSNQTQAMASDEVSNRVGETLSYTGKNPPGQQTVLSNMGITFGAGATGNEDVTIGGDTYTNVASAEDLANRINQAGSGYWASYSGSEVTIHGNGAASLAVSVADDAPGNLTVQGETLNDIVDAVDSGRGASGAFGLNLTTWADGDTITVGANTWTYNSGGTADFSDITELSTLLRGAGFTTTATGTANNGSLYIQASAVGTGSNGQAISSTTAGTFNAASATTAGGVENSASTLVDASALNTSGRYALNLSRSDTGAAATMTVAAGNTLGAGLSYDYNNFTQSSTASAGTGTTNPNGEATLAFDFNGKAQKVTLDFAPDGQRSVANAGKSTLLATDQDGYPAQQLKSLSFKDDGTIMGKYSGGEERALGMLAIADLPNPAGMKRFGDNLWQVSQESGAAVLTQAKSLANGTGSVKEGYLEASNVKMASSMTNMIIYQRAYQACSKSISTANEAMQTAINMVR